MVGGWACCIAALLLAAPAFSIRPLSDQAAESVRDEELNLRPLIGIVSQGGEPAPDGHSYIAASYIKFVEAAGARAVPILHDMPKHEVERRFRAVNGVLFPGGSQDLAPGNPYFDTCELLYKLTLQANDDGDFFPLHATCLGFEAVAVIASGNTSVLSKFDAEDYPQPLLPTEKAGTSRFFSALPPHVAQNLYTKPYAMQNHANGLSWAAFKENAALGEAFDVLTLSADRGDAVYVSTFEGKRYPISGTQWHPEKNAFEWAPDLSIPHHPDAIEVTQEVGNLVVGAARRSRHAPESRAEEQALLIYNWNDGLQFSGRSSHKGEEVDFDEIYVFPDAEAFMRRERALVAAAAAHEGAATAA